MSAYYNEIDPYAAQWLRNLMDYDLILPGEVDERSIVEVHPDDLKGFTQCHFFAGIGGWSLAARLARWPDDRRLWTGSCPCQPFSVAGGGSGFNDPRHLWPEFLRLITKHRPTEVFGEQVASKHADAWIDLVQLDLEALDYAFGCVPFPAAGIGSPHIRDRNYWVGYTNDSRPQGWSSTLSDYVRQIGQAAARGTAFGLADSSSRRREMAVQHNRSRDAADTERQASIARSNRFDFARPGATNNTWRDADWLCCRDSKWRPVEPGTQPLAHGVSSRMGRLRAYGNAIVPQQAAQFIEVVMELRP